ncbi:thiamine phosphate synthase [Candidatus Omnitrophota bacterium]
MKGYYFITDAKISRSGNISDVEDAVAAGVEVVQYRDKNKSAKEMKEEALVLRQICKDITFLINDRIDIAIAVGADGVHLGNEDLSYSKARELMGNYRIIGLTVHSLKEALEAQSVGADYLGVSPIFSTTTKPNAGAPAGVELIKEIKKRILIPIIAIGGITLANAPEVVESGADGLCAISAVITSSDVKAEIGKFQTLFHRR